MLPQAVIFDFNGTISDDEPLLERLVRELLAAEGVEISTETYYSELAGLSDPEVIDRGLEIGGVPADDGRRAELLCTLIERYKAAVEAKPTIAPATAEFVRAVAARVPVAIASGALRDPLTFVLERTGLLGLFPVIVTIDDVECGKPEPDGFLLALAELDRHLPLDRSIVASRVVVIEDSDAGVAAARSAGMRCVALAGPTYTGAGAGADLVVDGLRVDLVEEILAIGG